MSNKKEQTTKLPIHANSRDKTQNHVMQEARF